MRVLARNMAGLLKCKEAGMKAGKQLPMKEDIVLTNFGNNLNSCATRIPGRERTIETIDEARTVKIRIWRTIQ